MSKKIKKQQLSQYELLKKAWLKQHKKARKSLEKKHKRAIEFVSEKIPTKEQLAFGAVGGAMMASSVLPATPAVMDSLSGNFIDKPKEEARAQITLSAQDELKTVMPEQMRPLTPEEEARISPILSKHYGMNVAAVLDGKRLNRSYGVMGAEQHLMRYSGDTMASHLPPQQQSDRYIYSSGMAPGRGAWGYFANSRDSMTSLDVEREKYYLAVQTFLVPDYNQRVGEYRDFFKFRKMLVVNPTTGQAVVCVIGDAGPAEWTGKHLGGSPEVMVHLGYQNGMRKGAVLYFFVDDPDDTIPLGSVNMK